MAKEITKPTAQKTAAASAPPPRPPQAKPGVGTQALVRVTAEVRQVMICEAAYYIAEHRGFEPGHDVDDWLAAEEQIDAALTGPAPPAAGSRLQR